MADPYAATRELLADRPEIADALESLLDADATGPWTFEDVDIDSGTFGELVSRGVVERTDDGDAFRSRRPRAFHRSAASLSNIWHIRPRTTSRLRRRTG
ncbi:hypothetical protein, partial [Halorubrum tibetense]